mgnify:CR=1 FL=1
MRPLRRILDEIEPLFVRGGRLEDERGEAGYVVGELLKLRDEGCALLVVSEELDELFEISDRLLVIAKGMLSPSVPVAQATVEQIERAQRVAL